MARFRILHYSDLHFGEKANIENSAKLIWDRWKGGVSDTESASKKSTVPHKKILTPTTYSPSAEAALAWFVHRHRDEIDIAVLTGDLACTGRRADLIEAERFLNEVPTGTFFSGLDDFSVGFLKEITFLVPGNHDRYKNVLASPGCKNFDQVFAAQYPAENRVYSRTAVKGSDSLCIVFADFSFKSAVQPNGLAHRWGGGLVDRKTLGELADETERQRKSHRNCVVSWAIHFAPYSCGEELALTDYNYIIDVAKELGVKLIMCGHTHEPLFTASSKYVISCAGTAMCVDKRDEHYCHIIDIDIRKSEIVISREDYLYGGSSNFELDSSDDTKTLKRN